MLLKVFKNTVLFSIIIGISAGTFSCKNNGKQEVEQNTVKHIVDHSNTLAHYVDNDSKKTIIVGANRTAHYIPMLKHKRVAVVANQTSVIFKPEGYTHLVDSLLSLNISIEKVFSPEHGFRGTADAGELVKDGKDTKTGLPIYSLHGKHKKPTTSQLQGVDIIVFDIQDVGVRFYTYISTLHYIMEACAEQNIPVLLLDRPNPNGNYIDGPVLEEKHRSFLGMHPIPLVHGMTIGEYAKMINGQGWLKNDVTCDITIIEMQNYNHNSTYSLAIRPSPNLPNDNSILLYPSLGLFEGTNINAGRGTEFQFQRYGAPFLDKKHYTFSYTPEPNFGSKHPKHKNEMCYGVDLSHVNAERHFTLKYVMDAYHNATDKSKVFNTDNFTKHAGTTTLQKQIEAGLSETEIKATWQEDLNKYQHIRRLYLLYN